MNIEIHTTRTPTHISHTYTLTPQTTHTHTCMHAMMMLMMNGVDDDDDDHT